MLFDYFVIIICFLLSSICFIRVGGLAYQTQFSEGNLKAFCVLIIAISFQSLGFWLDGNLVTKIERKKAIKANAAHYVVDSKTGEISFEYLKLKEVEEK